MSWGRRGEPSPNTPPGAGLDTCLRVTGSRICRPRCDAQELWCPPERDHPEANPAMNLRSGKNTNTSSCQKVNFGSYDNYIPVSEANKKSWNQQHFSLMFPKPKRPGKKWRSTPSELRANLLKGDIEKDDQKATPMWMTRSLLKISERPSVYLAARRKPSVFTGPQKPSESTNSSSVEKKQMYKTEKNQVVKTAKKKMVGSPKGPKSKLPDTAYDILSRESDTESKGSKESKLKNDMNSHKEKEPETESNDVDVNKKNIAKKKKSKESDVESSDSKKKDKNSRSKSKDLDKDSKKKSKNADFEFKDTVKKDKDAKEKSRDSISESSGSKKIDKDLRKKSNIEQKKDKDAGKKFKDLSTESRNAKQKVKNSWMKSKNWNNKSQNLKMEDEKHKEGDAESQNSKESKKKSKESNTAKNSKKAQDGKVTFRGSDIESTKKEPETSRGTLYSKSRITQQMLPRIGKAEIRKAPLPEAQWIQKLI
ncbi:cylicin-1 isoform X1 [Notamacropus eugenii]|uniref:cylicin-1 isoform X1 n=1 Tax=Notamacropus eugenii TaxID=9315 RepID=UPI003B686003